MYKVKKRIEEYFDKYANARPLSGVFLVGPLPPRYDFKEPSISLYN